MKMQTTSTTFGRIMPSVGWSLPLGNWLRIARERRQLAKLTPELMKDIGIDPLEARREAGRHFWDVPAGRQ